MRKKTLSNPTSKRDFSSMHRHEINWNFFEIGMPLMPKMTNYASPIPTVGGIGYGFRPFKSSPLFVQTFLKFALYGRSNSTVTHTMQFDNNTSTKVDINYEHSITQYGLGLKYIFTGYSYGNNSFFKPFIEANLGRAHTKSSMWIPDPSEMNDCLPSLTSGVLNKFSGGIFSAGLGFKFGSIKGDCFFLILAIWAALDQWSAP